MIPWIQAHLMTVFAPMALLLALGLAVKKIPAMLEEKAKAALDKLFAEGDAADDQWLCATIQWAESKYGAASGATKADAVVNKLIGLLPLQYRVFATIGVRAKAKELFQASFDRLEAAVLKEAEEHRPVPAPAAVPQPAKDLTGDIDIK